MGSGIQLPEQGVVAGGIGPPYLKGVHHSWQPPHLQAEQGCMSGGSCRTSRLGNATAVVGECTQVPWAARGRPTACFAPHLMDLDCCNLLSQQLSPSSQKKAPELVQQPAQGAQSEGALHQVYPELN